MGFADFLDNHTFLEIYYGQQIIIILLLPICNQEKAPLRLMPTLEAGTLQCKIL
jgi:hypothetical protein